MVKQKPSGKKNTGQPCTECSEEEQKIGQNFAQKFYSLKFLPPSLAFKYTASYLPYVMYLVLKGVSIYKRHSGI